jgi:hypothetical protein
VILFTIFSKKRDEALKVKLYKEAWPSDGQEYDQELLFVCAAFHDMGLLKKFSSAEDRFEVDSVNAVRQFLEHHNVPAARIQVAWDAISLHTTPGIVRGRATKPSMATTCALGFVVVVIGMLFARYSHLALPQRSIRPRLQAG